MLFARRRPSDVHRPRNKRRAPLHLEALEDRMLLYSTTGGAWSNPNVVTLSFAPDGTNIGGYSSSLYQTLANDGISQAAWQQAFEKAAALWQGATGINIALVSDNGEAFGSSNAAQQGDPNVGDIRIGATPLSSNVLAEAFFPPPINGGSVAGDIVFNSNEVWHINSTYDLETVALHEIGHALGMNGSTQTTADMYETYNTIKGVLSSDDSAGIQSIYSGARTDSVANSSYSAATNITLNSAAQAAIADVSIAGANDVDWYRVTAPANTTGTLTVTMQASGLSLLSPKVTVYNSSLQALGSAGVANNFGGNETVTIGNVSPGQSFYIKAAVANSGAGASGAYGILVNFGSSTQSLINPPSAYVAAQASQGNSVSGVESTPQKTSGGGGLLGGLLGGVLNLVTTVVDDLLGITIGTLSGYGDALNVPAHAHAAHTQGHHHPVGPHASRTHGRA